MASCATNSSVLTLTSLLLITVTLAYAQPTCPIGTISDSSSLDGPASILIRGSSVRSSVPVYQQSLNATFTLPCLSPGDYVLELENARVYSDHLRITIDADGNIGAVEPRRDPMRIPGGGARVEGKALSFASVSQVQYGEPEQERWALLGYVFNPWTIAQLLIAVFLVAFPRYVSSLDRDILYEITGETPPDIGDPNGLVKSLLTRGNDGPRAEVVEEDSVPR